MSEGIPLFPTRLRQSAGVIVASAAAVEIGTALYVLAFGPFSTHLGPLPVLGGSATKPFAIGVLALSAAIWLFAPFQTSRTQARIVRACSVAAYAAFFAGMVSLLAPFFLPDFLIGHDGGVHQTYAYLFDRALRQGQFPVRWVEGLALGRAQPLFNYYQVGFYYLVAFIHACGPRLTLSIKLAIAVIWLGGGGFTYLWLLSRGRFPALLAASFFVWAPYFLVDGYVRTAYPELMAVALVPGVLWSLDRVLRTGRLVPVCTLALTTGLLLISHLPAALIVVPVCAAYVLGSWVVHRHAARRLALVGAGVALGVGVAAFYVLPALLELDAVRMSRLTNNYFDYHLHFVHPASWVNWSWGYAPSGTSEPHQVSYQIGILQWVAIVFAMATVLGGIAVRRWTMDAWALAGWLAVIAGALFMMTAASVGIWDRIAPLAFIQFPWRFLMLPVVASAALAASLLAMIRHRLTQALIVVCAIALQWSVTRDYRAPAWSRDRADIAVDAPDWAASANGQAWGFREAGYDPVSVSVDAPREAGRWVTTGGRGAVTPLAASDVRLSLRVEALDPLDLVIRSPFFPGWRLTLDDATIAPEVEPGSGYMAVQVPAGTHRVEATFGNTKVRTTANAISAASLIVLLLLLGGRVWRTRLSLRGRRPGWSSPPISSRSTSA